MDEQLLINTAGAAKILGIPEATLRYWRWVGEGPKSFKLGARKVAYKREDVLAWMEAQYAAAHGDEEGASA